MAQLAVIDIGTNSIHRVLAEILSDASYKILDRFKDMTRLGNGAFVLADESIRPRLSSSGNSVTPAR